MKKKYSVQFREALDDITAHIIPSWRDFGDYLQDLLSIGDEITLCLPYIGSKTLEDSHNMAWRIATAINKTQRLSNFNSGSQEILNHHKASVTKLLSVDSSSWRRDRDLKSIILFDELHSTSGHQMGLRAFTSLERSLAGAGSRFDDLISFWRDQHAVLRAFTHMVPQDTAHSQPKCSWLADRESVISSISSATMTYDALVVVMQQNPSTKKPHRDRFRQYISVSSHIYLHFGMNL
jgi:hypothetical protein